MTSDNAARQHFWSLRKDQAELGEQPADAVDAGRPLFLVALPQPVQRHHALLRDALDRHESHARPRSRLADRGRIGCIVLAGLAAQAIGRDEVRCDQLHMQAHCLQPPSPVVRPGTGFHRHQAARRQLRTPRREALALQLLGCDHSARHIDRVDLDRSLRQVDANACNLVHGLPLSASD
jgi:hypothetical protein